MAFDFEKVENTFEEIENMSVKFHVKVADDDKTIYLSS